MNARYILLIQKQFDQPLSECEAYELKGFLAGNEGAARLCENLQHILEDAEKIELPENLKPIDARILLSQILSAIDKNESKSWFSLVRNFVKSKSGNRNSGINVSHQDELAVLRKHKASVEQRSNKTLDTLRGKVVDEVASVTSHDAVSLAVAIKRRMLESTEGSSTASRSSDPGQSISESMDQLFSSANWPVVTPADVVESNNAEISVDEVQEFVAPQTPPLFNSVFKNRFNPKQQQQQTEQREHCAPAVTEPAAAIASQWSDPLPEISEHMEPVWQLELEAQVPIWQLEPLPPPRNVVPMHEETVPGSEETVPRTAETAPTPPQSPFQPELIRPARLIPVDDIIAHVSQMFSEEEASSEESAEPAEPTEPADPLGLSSGAYPQIKDIDLRNASSARLSTTHSTDESKGQIKALGKFLLDQQSEAAITNLSSANANLSNARILSDEEALALQECLSPIERLQGVAGCIILGYDGIVIMNTLPAHADQDVLSAWALLTYMNSHDLIRVIGHTRLRQFVSRTFTGYLLLADFGQGLLLAVSDNAATEAILPLMKSVRKVTAA